MNQVIGGFANRLQPVLCSSGGFESAVASSATFATFAARAGLVDNQGAEVLSSFCQTGGRIMTTGAPDSSPRPLASSICFGAAD
jgi:hypothetical protein